MANRLLVSEAASDEQRIADAFRLLLSRDPSAEELTTVGEFLNTCRDQVESKKVDAAAIAGAAREPRVEERAAWTLVARALLNLDETITKQ